MDLVFHQLAALLLLYSKPGDKTYFQMVFSFNDVLQWGRRINLSAIRMFALISMFLCLMPMASIYVIFTSYTSPKNVDHGDLNPGDQASLEATTAHLLMTLHNPNATIDQIFSAVIRERANAFAGRGGMPSLSYHWATVIPWLLSLLFGFVIPILLYIMSLIRSRRRMLERESDLAGYRIRRRRERIQRCLYDFTAVRIENVCCERIFRWMRALGT